MRLFTSESVTPGHPDKVCDQVSDAILDAYLERDPGARVAVEAMATASGLVLAGEVSSVASVDHAAAAAEVLRDLGYGAYLQHGVLDRITAQSPEIAAGVARSLEARSAGVEVDPLEAQGAGDQGLMFGYAVNETPELMPLPITLAHALAAQLWLRGRQDEFAALGPDGKTQVTVRYDGEGRPAGLESLLVSTQHARRLQADQVRRIVLDEVVSPVLERFGETVAAGRVLVNPSGSFVDGGPAVDAGLTGRKIIVDTYGGAARHGGGAFSGKDGSKVDRSGAYAARWIAKHVVAAGLASRCEVQLAYAIGSAHPVGVYATTYATGIVSGQALAAAIREVFDLRPAAIVRDLRLTRPDFLRTATLGHFGVAGFTWEELDPLRLDALREAALRGSFRSI